MALELEDGTIITAKTSSLLLAPAAFDFKRFKILCEYFATQFLYFHE